MDDLGLDLQDDVLQTQDYCNKGRVGCWAVFNEVVSGVKSALIS